MTDEGSTAPANPQTARPNPVLLQLDVFVGEWEKSEDGSHWEHDFDLMYTKVG